MSRQPVAASFVRDEIEKQIEENESLRFGSAPFWNTFLQPSRQRAWPSGVLPTFFVKFLLGLLPKDVRVCVSS
jgi:hypothetical protein